MSRVPSHHMEQAQLARFVKNTRSWTFALIAFIDA
jgi:hypothetical protein